MQRYGGIKNESVQIRQDVSEDFHTQFAYVTALPGMHNVTAEIRLWPFSLSVLSVSRYSSFTSVRYLLPPAQPPSGEQVISHFHWCTVPPGSRLAPGFANLDLSDMAQRCTLGTRGLLSESEDEREFTFCTFSQGLFTDLNRDQDIICVIVSIRTLSRRLTFFTEMLARGISSFRNLRHRRRVYQGNLDTLCRTSGELGMFKYAWIEYCLLNRRLRGIAEEEQALCELFECFRRRWDEEGDPGDVGSMRKVIRATRGR